MPRISDRTDGFFRRMLAVPFDKQVLDDKKKVAGMETVELWYEHANPAGILNWASAGLRRLQDNGMRLYQTQAM